MDKTKIEPIKRFIIHIKYPIIIGAAFLSYLGANAIVHPITSQSNLKIKVQLIEPNNHSPPEPNTHDITEPNSNYEIIYKNN